MNIGVISFVRHFNSTPPRTAATYLLKERIRAWKSKERRWTVFHWALFKDMNTGRRRGRVNPMLEVVISSLTLKGAQTHRKQQLSHTDNEALPHPQAQPGWPLSTQKQESSLDDGKVLLRSMLIFSHPYSVNTYFKVNLCSSCPSKNRRFPWF